MPYPIYNIGDYISHDDFGKGIIVSIQYHNGAPVHHARFFTKCHGFQYIDDNDITKIRLYASADEKTIRAAQNLLMDLFTVHSYDHPYIYVGECIDGDIVMHKILGKCLVIGGDDLGMRGRKTRHVYAYATDRFYYTNNAELNVIQRRTPATLKESHNLWLSRILPQPFDTTTE